MVGLLALNQLTDGFDSPVPFLWVVNTVKVCRQKHENRPENEWLIKLLNKIENTKDDTI